ncbi:MAG: hypothetical protein PHD20_06245 [Clostridia bacterium]|nr:hypothetical protein [Clostridia bacterium]
MFENIIGHEEQINIIKRDIKEKSISHAYAFIGPTGVGKKLLAEEFSKILLDNANLEACIDYTFIERKEGKKDIVVEQIRKGIVEDLYVAPASRKP